MIDLEYRGSMNETERNGGGISLIWHEKSAIDNFDTFVIVSLPHSSKFFVLRYQAQLGLVIFVNYVT